MPDAARTAGERLLDSAAVLLGDATWSDLSMAAVAENAGVSRQTLYNAFGTRRQLAQALLLREVESFLSDVETELHAASDDPEAALERAFAAYLRGIEQNPLVRAIVVDEDPDLLALLIEQGINVVGYASARLGGAIGALWPQAADADVALLSDALVRLAISFAVFPSSAERDVAGEIRALLAPFVLRALA
ncbi:MAG: TetR family transcriptional regulator [Baekduia sp.]